MSGLPSGAVTFLFSDIEGSTRLVKALRERYAEVLAGHRRLVRAAFAAHGGHEVDTQGDAFFAAFGGAKQAVLCALDIQRALAAHPWPGGARVRVRIGIHTGQAVPAEGAYTGLAVHRAARICAAADGGQVLISQATQTLIEDEEETEPGFTLVDVGERRLKDLDRPVRLFQLAAVGPDTPSLPGGGWQAAGHMGGPGTVLAAEDADPGAGAAAAVVHGLPVALTSFIGRDEPVREVAGLLDKHRLVTVTGPGGSGKTRLMGEVARQVAARFADGAWLAELAPVQDAGQVPAVVAAALGVRDLPAVPAPEALARALARRQLLLVLDNCEQVIGAAAELCAGLLSAADDVKILATSREPLAVAGEARYRLAPLALPDLHDLAAVARAEAVALFADRARSAYAGFALDEQTGPAVARLVRRLDGMPLAIELAAARVETLGVTGLLDRLGDRFALLTSGNRTAPPRQRSLAAMVEWSYQLLEKDEQRVFRQLSVFPGSFTLEGADAVAGAGAEAAVLRLVDCSLVSPPRPGLDGRSRYVMLETLRTYGAGLLAGAGDDAAAAAALAGYGLGVAEQAAAGLRTTTADVAAARWLDAEDATVRQALAWTREHDTAMAVRLVVALAAWWQLRGRFVEALPLLQEAVGHAAVGSEVWCGARYWLGDAAWYSADMAAALDHLTAVRDAFTGRPARQVLVDCLAARTGILSHLGRRAEAVDNGRRALGLARELGYPLGEWLAMFGLTRAAFDAGDFRGALEFARQAEQITADIPGRMARNWSCVMTGLLAEAGDPVAAEATCAAGLARCREAGDIWSLSELLYLRAELGLRTDRTQDAAAHLREALQITARTGGSFQLVDALYACAWLCAATGSREDALTLWAARTAICQRAGLAPAEPKAYHPLRHALRSAEQELGPDRAGAARQRGAAMGADTAAEYALMLTAIDPQQPEAAPTLLKLTAREQELVTLVAQGRTDAQIAEQLYVSIRTVRSQLDRIRDKTGCRRRADLTRLALSTELV
jgi:predicted ATPase/class 3 adenylate cyclase/DNA-binding CsgD family transcriptional regulator